MSNKIAANQTEKILKLAVEDKISTTDIAERLGCKGQTISRVLRTAGCVYDKGSRTWGQPKREEEDDDQ